MTLKEVLDKSTQFFKDKNFDSPRLDAELLLVKGLKLKNRMELYLKYEQPLKEDELVLCRELVKRRSLGEPVAYILQEKEFFTFPFEVSPAVLIPRPETETLVETILDWAAKQEDQALQILDLGTGSGCIGITLAKKLSKAQVTCLDISAEALVLAKKNAIRLEVADRMDFIHEDASSFKVTEKKFNIIVSNPPYIAEGDPEMEENVKKFEPHAALFANDNGHAFLKSWSQRFAPELKSTAIMAFEMGSTQSPEMKNHYESLRIFDEIKVIKDLAGQARHIVGIKNG